MINAVIFVPTRIVKDETKGLIWYYCIRVKCFTRIFFTIFSCSNSVWNRVAIIPRNSLSLFYYNGVWRIWIRSIDAKNYSADEEETATAKMLAYMTNLDVGFGGLFFPNAKTNSFTYPTNKTQEPKHHFNLKLMHYGMKPVDSMESINEKNAALEHLLSEILYKSALVPSQNYRSQSS